MRIHGKIIKVAASMLALLFISQTQCFALGDALTGQASVSHGAQEWGNNCARCHNLRPASEFSANNWQPIMMHMRMQAGIVGQEARNIYAFLASQSGQAPAPQAAAVETSNNATANTSVQSVRTKIALATNTSAAATPTNAKPAAKAGLSGAAIYQQTCVVCHGANGKGAIPGAPDFTGPNSPLKKSDVVLTQHITNGFQSPGSSMAMPAKGGNSSLSNADIKAVLSYIRSKF